MTAALIIGLLFLTTWLAYEIPARIDRRRDDSN